MGGQTSNLQKHLGSTLKKTNSIFVEDDSYCKKESSGKSDDNYRKHVPTMVTQHQQQYAFKTVTSKTPNERDGSDEQHNLYIPVRDDEDNKSQHSHRTISSSRRQSTEDSIDTDDEYYCYELRKLEELEYESKIEQSSRTMADEEAKKSLFSKIGALNTDTEIWYAYSFHTFHTSFEYFSYFFCYGTSVLKCVQIF